MMAGSVTEAVLAGSTSPVLVLGPDTSPEQLGSGDSVVICVDETSVCESIIAPAASLVAALGRTAILVEVVPPEERVKIDDVAAVDDPTDVGTARLDHVQSMLTSQGVDTVETHVLYGADVAESIAHFARERHAAAVALSSHGRSGVRRLLHGSTTMRLIAIAPCPVLTVRCDVRD
jgi:nucleotide-binding universal stress UspA family protein